jgi:AraC-like DNA-binding protein
MVGRELAPGRALSLAMDYSDLLLRHPGAVKEAGMQIATHLTDLVALGLGARGDLATAAERGGLRAIRLKAVLMILEKRFAEPDFSAQKLATAAGLSERYVNELLYEAGASFTMRLTELRLRKAADMLRVQRSVLFQPLLSPPFRADALGGAGAVAVRTIRTVATSPGVRRDGVKSDAMTQLAPASRVTI